MSRSSASARSASRRVASASPLICSAHGSCVSGWARVAACPSALAEIDRLVHLTHRSHRIASQCKGERLERQRADAGIVVPVEIRERVMDLRAVDGAPRIGGCDRLVDLPAEQAVHPAGVEGLQPHRIVALGRQLGQPLDEPHRPVEVPPMAVIDGESHLGREMLGGGGAAPSSARWPAYTLALPRARPARAVQRERLPAAAAAQPRCGCARRSSGSCPTSVIAPEKCSTARSFAESRIARRPARWSACVARCARVATSSPAARA